MRTYTLRNMPDGKVYVYTDEEIDRLDREQNRRRLAGDELDGLILMQCGLIAMETGAKDCERYMKERKQAGRIKPCIAQMGKAIDDMSNHIAGRQFITLHNNCHHVALTVSSLPVHQCVNLRQDHVNRIVSAALNNCAATCMLTREQSKCCELRRALETVPGLKEAARGTMNLGGCPYMLL